MTRVFNQHLVGSVVALVALFGFVGISPACLFALEPGANIESKEEHAIKQAAAVVAPSLVRIETVGGLDRVGQVLTVTGPTTGIVVSPDGYIISSAFNF